MWYLLILIALLLLGIYSFFVRSEFVNFELADRRSIVNSKRRTRKYGPGVPPPYPNGWFAIEQSRNIKPGTAKNVDCLGENFVVFRSKTNEVYVLDAYCPHMGANIGIGGKVKGNCVECPFHSWRFSGETGECVDIPYSESCDDVKKQAKLRKWISKENDGFIFVWYHAENEEPWELPDLKLIQYKLNACAELLVHNHIQEFFENSHDQEHLNPVHSASALAGKRPNNSWLKNVLIQSVKVQWLADLKDFFKSKVETKVEMLLFGKYVVHAPQMDILIYGPGIFIFGFETYLGGVYVYAALNPIDAYSFKCTLLTYSSNVLLTLMAKFSAHSIKVNLARDMAIWNLKQYKKNPLLVKEERNTKESRAWYSKFYSPNSKTFEEAKNSMEW